MALHNHRHPDRADMGGGADVHERWGSGMTDWREELIEKMAKAVWPKDAAVIWDVCPIWLKQRNLEDARAALAVAEPVIREQADDALREENARLREERDKAVEEMWKASDQAQAFRKMAEERKA